MTQALTTSRTRRDILRFAAFGAGTLLLPRWSVIEAGANERDPHFFLLIVLNGGADCSYMFDARPLAMTAAGRIQNYLGREPQPWRGRNGVSSLATALVQPLIPFRDRFSVLNGVYMTPSFDGHLQNMNFLFTGNPFGGDSFVPHLNSAETGRQPGSLDAILSSEAVMISVNNHSGVVPLLPNSVRGLSETLKTIEPPQPGHELIDYLRARLMANATGRGRMNAATNLMLSGLDEAPNVHRRLAQLTAPDPRLSPERQSLALVAECFRLSISRSAIYALPEQFDVHAADQAKLQPKLFASAIGRISELMRGLVDTPFDAKRSMFDVTTVMIASEFGRTLRSLDAPIDNTGTNHNQFSNSVLIGGKGIRGGMVIGESDFDTATTRLSKAHLSLDPILEKSMGRPFDFRTSRPRPDLPEAFAIADYLTIGSAINTIYSLFDVPKAHYRLLGRDLPAAPTLNGLLA